tara:strand:+ start:420 stop:701 length:282 start_codon:yes stop_codon:yes gene_type:complete
MSKFNGASMKQCRIKGKLTMNDMQGECFVRGHKVCLKTLYRWEDPKSIAQPKAEHLMVIGDIFLEHDPDFKITDLFLRFDKKNDMSKQVTMQT